MSARFKSSTVPSGYRLHHLKAYPVDSSTQAGLESMLLACGVDQSVPSYLNLAEALAVILQVEPHLSPPLNRQWIHWRKLTSILLAKSSSIGKRWADSIHNKAERYPILVCLLQASALPQQTQILALKRLLLVGCMLHEMNLPLKPAILHQAAAQIRLASTEASQRSRMALHLPSGPFGLSYLITLSKTTSDLPTGTKSDSSAGRMFQAINRLATSVLMSKSLSQRRKLVQALDAVDPLSNFGDFAALNTANDPDIDGELDQAQFLIEQVTKSGDELSDEGLIAAGAQSRSWLAQTQCGMLWQRSRISPYEWPYLQKLLHNLPQLVKNSSLTVTQALGVALVAVTGLAIEELLALTIGPGADLTWEGGFLRKFTTPEQAFRPTTSDRKWFESAPATEIALQLPTTVKLLLHAVTPDDPSRTCTLSQTLGVQSSNPTENSSSISRMRELIGRLLREQVNRRLEHRHLQTVLRNKTFDYTQDAVVAYLIAGRSNQCPPVQMYYTRFSADHLHEIHRNVVNSIFGDA